MMDTGSNIIQAGAPIDAWVSQNRPHWSRAAIDRWDENRLQSLMPFVRSHYWSDRHSVNVFAVVGTAHPDYCGMSWEQFLAAGKRMRANKALLESNPEYYFDTGVKLPTMLFVSLNGKHWYVNGDGNHRTCLAKFHFARLSALGLATQTMIHGVTIDDYRVDWRLHDAYLKLKEALRAARSPATVEGYRYHIGRDDGPGWKVDRYDPKIRLVSGDGTETLLDADAARIQLARLGRPAGGLLRWLR